MVVIAIVGIIVSAATSSYRNYIGLSNLAKGHALMMSAMQDLALDYTANEEQFPSSLTINNIATPSGSWHAINLENIAYVVSDDSFGDGLVVSAIFNDLESVPDFVDPGSGSTPTTIAGSMLSYAVTEVDGIVKIECGIQSNLTASYYINSEYFPSNCTCNSVQTFSSTGSCS